MRDARVLCTELIFMTKIQRVASIAVAPPAIVWLAPLHPIPATVTSGHLGLHGEM